MHLGAANFNMRCPHRPMHMQEIYYCLTVRLMRPAWINCSHRQLLIARELWKVCGLNHVLWESKPCSCTVALLEHAFSYIRSFKQLRECLFPGKDEQYANTISVLNNLVAITILWPTMEPLHIHLSRSHTLQNWGMVAPEEGKLGRENINCFMFRQVFWLPRKWVAEGGGCTRELQDYLGLWLPTWMMFIREQIQAHPWDQTVWGRNWKATKRGIVFPRTSWFYSFMVYCNTLMLSMGAIILEDWNSKSQHWTYCPALGFTWLSELVIPSQSMEKNTYAKGQIYLILRQTCERPQTNNNTVPPSVHKLYMDDSWDTCIYTVDI